MEMEPNVNVTKENYGNVGFGWIVGTRMAPLMLLGVWGSPMLGLGSTNVLVISLGLWRVCSHLCALNGDDALVIEGRIRWFHDCI